MSARHATLDPDHAKALLERWAGMSSPILTIQMPLQPAGPQVEQNEIRRKNARRAAEQQLDALEDEAAATGLRDQLDALDEADLENVSPDTRGAVWFLGEDHADVIWTPFEVEERVVVASVAAIGSLLPLLDGVDTFHLLALSENSVRMFRGNEAALEEIKLEDVGSSLEDERWMDDFETSLQWRASARGSTSVIHHGHGGASDHEEKRERQFFLAVARGVHAWRRRQADGIPFVIAAVERAASGFVEAYADAPKPAFVVEGNPDDLDADALRARAVAGLRERRQSTHEAAAGSLAAARAEGQTSQDAVEIAHHASLGRIASLYVSPAANLPARRDGTRDDGTPNWIQDDKGSENLVDVCVAGTIQHGGAVTLRQDADDEAPALEAILRY